MIAAGWSPSVRLFEAGACATAVISDRWEGLAELFEPGRDLVLASSSEYVIAQLTKAGAEATIGRAARLRVLADHTARHCALELERHIGEAAAIKARQIRSQPRECRVSDRKERVALVSGGAGFIGSHLCDRLIAQGERVVCVDNFQTGRRSNLAHLEDEPRFEVIDHDIVNDLPPRLRRIRFTHIYHLACAASPPHYQADPEHTMLTNVVGTRNMLRLAESSGARLLLTSTSEVYGDPEMHPQHEDYRGWVNCTGPRACYDEGKRAAETLAFDYRRSDRAEVRVARIFNTYGPRMRADDGRVVSNVICQALRDDDITIYGDGSQTRSFCYVDDLIDGLMLLMDSQEADGVPVNLGNPDEMTVRELVKLVVKMTRSRSEIVRRPLPEDDPRRRKPDIRRAKALLGWEPQISLQEGLSETIAWFQQDQEPERRGWRGAAPRDVETPVIQAAE
jgi:nucleoside-diphosphate-sugar epimerase